MRAQLGDRGSLDELYGGVSARLLRYIRAIVRDDASAGDVLQDVLLIVYRKIRWLDDPASFKAWTFRLAGREAIRAASKGRSKQEAQLTDAELAIVAFGAHVSQVGLRIVRAIESADARAGG